MVQGPIVFYAPLSCHNSSNRPFVSNCQAIFLNSRFDPEPILLFTRVLWRQGYQAMNIFSSKAAIFTAPNRRTRFIPETESSEPFVKGFTGLPGAFLKGQGDLFGDRASERGLRSIFESNMQEIAISQKETRHLFRISRFEPGHAFQNTMSRFVGNTINVVNLNKLICQ